MKSAINEAVAILRQLSENGVDKALAALKDIKKEDVQERESEKPDCPKCGSARVFRNGHKNNKQAYICRDCKKGFVETTRTAISGSHSGEAVWKQVIRDTVDGIPINTTANNTGLHHETVFNMRHKILYALEQEEMSNPTQLEGVCELDETYVLESYKGSKLPSDYWRKPRKHGAVAVKPGLSNEYICVCAGVERDGSALAKAVNRATASSDEIRDVFGDRVKESAVVMTDGLGSYNVLKEAGNRAVFDVVGIDNEHFHINNVNSFHSYLKERVRGARGFATKYLNRYNAMFSKTFRASTDYIVDVIYRIVCDRSNRSHTIAQVLTTGLLDI